ncbi:pyrroline-5-carboxylate reductase [Anaerobacillus alkaliphilus]|uniref:Pyrroline-5-carboxylate reductase n=1 Tax=Anaerobacillus alkaliphilus TaxID=1548597 RepID=A0A4Q0VQY1_9BACI|nr:pyrroline-5-carboxylate reductase [Anaerobacillus alkaliphilus]RXI98619.1 pyrroline-5-carboxylate reductase [Anaerobacillus alkaliphilus]
MFTNETITFIGAGSMAEAMIAGLLKNEIVAPQQIIVTNKTNVERRSELKETYGINETNNLEFAIKEATIVILAIKPKDITTITNKLRGVITEKHVIMSVLAGITSSFIEEELMAAIPVIRVMPNTSSMIGESATAIAGGKYTSMPQMLMAKDLLTAIGQVFVIEEEQMDVFTGVAGSGPAYFYKLIEHLQKAACDGGLKPPLAKEIAVQTIVGAAKMLEETSTEPATLRKNITSPNGTTEAGLKALEAAGGCTAIEAAVKGAASRSKELRTEYEAVISK